MAKKADPKLVNDPKLSAAVLDGLSGDLRRELEAKGVPYVLYSAREQTDGVPVIQKPAPSAEVVARVEQPLR
jgi:hypothetical protein